ncbi:MAG: hypothetical protein ACTSXP_08615, partial [Promethearchaeota archaeon]
RDMALEKLTALLDAARALLSARDWPKAIKNARAAVNHAVNAGLNNSIPEAERLIKEINESWTRSIRERASMASEMLKAVDFQGARDLSNQLRHGVVDNISKATSLIKNLRQEAVEGGFSDVISMIDKMYDSVTNAWRSSLQSRAGAVSQKLESGDFSGAVSLLSSLESEARKAGLQDLAAGFKKRVKMAGILQKLSAMLQSSTRLRIDDVSSLLDVDRVDLMSLLLDWSGRMGFKIDGDFIVTSGEMDVGAFIADLDRQFAEWSESEKDKRGKI